MWPITSRSKPSNERSVGRVVGVFAESELAHEQLVRIGGHELLAFPLCVYDLID